MAPLESLPAPSPPDHPPGAPCTSLGPEEVHKYQHSIYCRCIGLYSDPSQCDTPTARHEDTIYKTWHKIKCMTAQNNHTTRHSVCSYTHLTANRPEKSTYIHVCYLLYTRVGVLKSCKVSPLPNSNIKIKQENLPHCLEAVMSQV